MIDLGQATTAQERRDAIKPHAWPSAQERAARNRAIETDNAADWQHWRDLRAQRLEIGQ